MMTDVNVIALFGMYILILALHFGYAYWVLKTNRFSLELGIVRTRFQILSLLLLLNGFSISVFYYSNQMWIQVNIILHMLLTLDEVVRTWKNSLRLPFLLNHVLFAGLLLIFLNRTG